VHGSHANASCFLQTPAPDYGSAASEATRASPAADAPTDQYAYGGGMSRESLSGDAAVGKTAASFRESPVEGPTVAFQRTLFEGSPAYKRRRVRSRQGTSPSVIEDGARRGSPGPQRGYTPQYRDQTASPKYQHQQLRKVSGERQVRHARIPRPASQSIMTMLTTIRWGRPRRQPSWNQARTINICDAGRR
jgi:hypothetical protein